MFLQEIETKLTELKGIGPATAKSFAGLGITTVRELLLHAPRFYEDRLTRVSFSDSIKRGRAVNTEATVLAHDWFGFGRKRTLKVWLEDESTRAALNCFGRNFLSDKLVIGLRIRIYGEFSYRFGEIQASQFEFEPAATPASRSSFGTLLPIYPASADLTQRTIRNAVKRALEGFGKQIEDELPPECNGGEEQQKARLIHDLHFPTSREAAESSRKALAREELFYLQLVLGRRSLIHRDASRTRTVTAGDLAQKVIAALPFRLTDDQTISLEEIREDLSRPRPMSRLLQGDVGSGKTLTAFLAACETVEAGEQAAFMAPTELLARQHADNAARLLEPAGLHTALLTGALSGPARKELLTRLRGGEIDLLIGTHALFSADVHFRQLGLVIIDEQQRFGVLQRTALKEKGKAADLLVMTATPIPRTLAMTLFGDLDVSTIKTMPPGRKPVITHLAALGKEDKVYSWLENEISAGHQAYCVYPLIDESGKLELKHAEGMFSALKKRYPRFRLGLIHSRLDEEEKRAAMAGFAAGELDLLVATSVVEVGVDVANATCMVVEHAERFGLSALHQLRGRVGRDRHQGYLFLVYDPELTDAGKLRLKVMKETTDGFTVAEEDLKIRGPGNISGTEQAGFLRLRFADLVSDADLMFRARKETRSLLAEDPGLLEPKHALLRRVLSRTRPFEAEESVHGSA